MSFNNDQWFPPSKQTVHYHLKITAIDAGISAVISASLYPLSMIWMAQQNPINSGYPSIWRACRHIYAHRSWYAGFPISAASEIPGNLAYLTGRGAVAMAFGDEGYISLLQSPVATSCGMIFWAPGIRLSLLQQVSAQSGKQQLFAWTHSQKIIREHGIKDLYRGTGIYAGIFGLSDLFGTLLQTSILQHADEKNRQQPAMRLIATWVGFSISALFTIPLEAAVLPYMIQEMRDDFTHKKRMLTLVKEMYRASGVRAFTRGLPLGVVHLGLWHSIIPAKECVMSSFQKNCQSNLSG